MCTAADGADRKTTCSGKTEEKRIQDRQLDESQETTNMGRIHQATALALAVALTLAAPASAARENNPYCAMDPATLDPAKDL
jgi:hypothetical protein